MSLKSFMIGEPRIGYPGARAFRLHIFKTLKKGGFGDLLQSSELFILYPFDGFSLVLSLFFILKPYLVL